MELYIFRSNRRTPYLNYGFYIPEVKEYVFKSINDMSYFLDYPCDSQFLKDWVTYLEENKDFFFLDNNDQQSMIYQHAIDNLKECIETLECDPTGFEAYIAK